MSSSQERSSSSSDTPRERYSDDDQLVTLTIRILMQGKEVGSIIGKKGEIVKRLREESSARINISDGSTPERIVSVSGTSSAIHKAFKLICTKFEEDYHNNPSGGGVPRPPITLRLIVPASQCGSLIGKGGSKIKEIREVTGANIQVASEMLPNSTERAVTISGNSDAITQCIRHICGVMMDAPAKGATIPYRPKQQVNGPIVLAGGQAYAIQGNFAVPTLPDLHKVGNSPLAGLLGGLGGNSGGGINPAALAAIAGSQLMGNQKQGGQTQSQELTVPNELIGCIIGKGGSKIAEIRQISGAMIRISNCEDREGGGNTDRVVTISGSPDSVSLAQCLINTSIELQKANLEAQKNQPQSSGSSNSGSNPMAIPLAQLLSKPGALNALTTMTGLGGLLSGGHNQQHVQTTGVHRQSNRNYVPKLKSQNSSGSSGHRSDRNKFSPY